MNEPNVNPIQQPSETVSSLRLHKDKPQKTAQDWVRDMRMSAAVNKATTGVETDQVTPDLLLATSKKLLGISKREQEPDPKDSLAFQRFYGPEMMFSEHILRDNGKLGRNILWKATNRGNLDFMPVNALEKHISSVFYDSKLAQMMDGSSPLETIDSAYKTTRLGEGGIGSIDSAPDEMRTVQPSYFGYIDPVRCFAKGTEIKTEDGWKAIEDITADDKIYLPSTGVYEKPLDILKYKYNGEMISYDDGTVKFCVTPHHLIWHAAAPAWIKSYACDVFGKKIAVNVSDTTQEVCYVLSENAWDWTLNSCDFVYCLTVTGGLLLTRYNKCKLPIILSNSPESLRVGLDVYMTKNVMKGTDGKLYQKFIDAKTGKEVLLDSETAANSVIAAPEMRNAKTKSVFAMGGPTGIRIVPRDSVQYYLPRADEAYSTSSNLVTMLSGVKNMRLQMGCLHPDTFVITKDKHGLLSTTKAQTLSEGSIPGSTKEGLSQVFDIRTTVAKFPPQKNWFRKVILKSGRSLITSADHRWPILRKGEYQLVPAAKLKKGDIALRTTFKDFPSRRTFVNHILVNKLIARHLGYIARSLDEPDNRKMRVQLPEEKYEEFLHVMERLGYKDGFNTYYMGYTFCVGIRDEQLKQLLRDMFGPTDKTRHIPSEILSAGAAVVGAFLDGYTSDPTKLGQDSNDDIWVLDIPNLQMRDELAFLFARLETDTLYRDKVSGKAMDLALKLVPMNPGYGDMITDEIKLVQDGINAPIMIDIDVNDNLYATANGVVTHNSKYPLQAVSISSREAPLVRGLDEATGKDMPTLVGKYLGARFAPNDGVVTAVRKDRIDVLYDDGTKGSVDMYVNFPMNAKGYINNKPQVKAGQHFKKGDILASSNYTDDKGVAAMGTNLRTGWLSWKGGTYEDAIVISESAAKKLTSTTMYKTSVDLDKTISLGKQNYITWKPGEFTKEQMENLDASGVVKPGTVLHKEDPMILAVRTSEPSPGTMGKRVLTDLSERWEHDNPGVVTDVVKTRNGVKVYATVTADAQLGDKLTGAYGNKGVVSCFDSETYVFTNRGFIKFEDLTYGDQVAAIDENGHATFEYPKSIMHYLYDGPLYKFGNKKINYAVTPNHMMIGKYTHKFDPENPAFERIRADEMHGRQTVIPTTVTFDENPHTLPTTITLPEYHWSGYGNQPEDVKNTFDLMDYAKLLGIFLAEGDAKRKQTYFVITQAELATEPDSYIRCKKIEDLLNHMGVAWRRSGIKFIVKNKPLWQDFHRFGKSHEKFIPEEVFTQWPREAQEALLEWHYMGDGDKTGTTHRCCTVSLQLAHDLQRLHTLCGRKCSVSYSDKRYLATRSTHKRKMYRVTDYAEDVKWTYVGNSNNKDKFTVEPYQGNVHCVEVSTGRILVCRNGKTLICGNCIVPDDEMPRNAKGEPLELLFSPLGLITRCYDDQTEFLTAKGWKLGKDITPEDKFYSYDPETDTWHWSEQLEPFYSNRYTGVMYDYHGRLADFSVTHGHKFWASVNGTYQQVQVQDIFGKSVKVPSVASRYSQPEATDFHLPFVDGCRAEIPDTYNAADWAEFLGWYLSEGYAEYNEATANYCVTITQFDNINPAKVQLIGQMLDRLGLPWKYSTAGKRFRIYNKRLAAYLHQFGLAHQKYIPDWLFSQPDYVIDRFLDGFIMGDGYVGPGYEHIDGTMLYRCTVKITSEKLIDQLQMLCCMVGLPSMKTYVGPDERYPNSKPQWSLGISFADGERALLRGWEKREYDGMVYCPTVDTGYVLTRRNGKTIIAHNTNPSQLYEALLGKVAHKTGKPITVPQFFDGSMADYVTEQLKQHNIKPDEDLINPETGLPIKDVLTGYSYIYKLKHMSESKMSARGTSSYDAEGQPAGKGMDGCFPSIQYIQTRSGLRSISAVAKTVGIESVTTMADNKARRYSRVIDRFFRVVSATELLSITPAWSYSPEGKITAPVTMYPTKNHAIYMYDMTQQHAEQLKPGCKLAGMGKRPSDHQMQVIWNLMHQPGVVDNERLWVPYDPEAADLAAFKVSVLKSLGAKHDKKGCAIILPHYQLYQAAIEDSDNGDLAIALGALDDAAKDYPISDAIKRIIADWVPAKVIPDYAYAAKQIAEKQQRLIPPYDLDVVPHMGLMPIIVARIDPYPKYRGPVKVYDLTVEELHRYVLKGGFLVSNSKRFGTLEQSAMAGHRAFDVIKDAKFIRGQSNSDFWRSIRTGDIPTMPGEPLVHKKFFAHLTGAGVNVRKTPQGVSIFALTEKDVDELAGPRELKSRDTYEARNFRPIDGGLFGQDIFGINGDKWGYIQLDEPVPNPVMEEPLARLLNIPDKKFADVAAGKEEINGIRGGAEMKAALEKLDLSAEAVRAHQAFKTAAPSNKDKALKRYIAIERMRRSGVNPADYMLERIPVLPPVYRPISTHNGLTMVADSNYLYAQLLDARDDVREAKDLPKELQQTARENLYTKWKELTGLYAPSDVKLQSKHVQGLLKWALGDSPKFGGFSRKVLSATVDTVGRGVITPDARLKLNEVGLPEEMAFNIMAPMVERKLVKEGYTPLQAMKMVKEKHIQARDALDEVMQNHPVLINRAPTLHKLSIIGLNPRLVTGHAIRINPSIVSTLAADFDGDTISGEWSVVLDLKKLEENREILEKSGKKFLTFAGRVLHYIQGIDSDAETHTNGKEQDMFSKTAKARYTTAICSPAELPVIPGSEKQLSDNVTEWDVIPGVYTDTIDLDGSRVLAPVTKISRHTNLKMFDVTTSVSTKYQSVITASEDHSLIAINPETLDLEKVRPEDAVGRLIPRLRRDQTVTHETCQRYIQFDKPYEANYDLGLLLGLMIGDGWVACNNQAIIACCDESLQKEILRLIDPATTQFPVLRQAKVDSYEKTEGRYSGHAMQRINLHLEGPFKTALKELIGTGAYNKHIPAPCFRASKAHRLGILMGLLATDGCVNYAEGTTAKRSKSKSIIYHTTSTELRDGVKYLCNSLGIRVSVTPYMGPNSRETCYAVCLSIVDVAREASHNSKLFRIPCEKKQKALEKICADVEAHEAACPAVTDIVPFPAALSEELTWSCKANPSCVSAWRKRGYISLDRAQLLALELRHMDWSKFEPPKSYINKLRRGHTPEQAAELVNAWCDIVDASDYLAWVHVDKVVPSTCTEGWDCTVPGPYTFALYDGTIVQDTVNIHAPVSDKARQEAYNRMFPERNLIGMRSRTILYKPEKEYQQGLYIGTRMKKGDNVRTHYFNTLEEAKEAYRQGLIDIDDPIEIKHN